MPFFTVITITKSNPVGFNKTKKSIESQSFNDFEWIVVDGDVEPDSGIYDAMNKGLSRARGDYIVFMNAGDVFAGPSTLQDVFDHGEGADLIYGDAVEDGYIKRAKPHHQIACGLFTHHQSIYYKRSFIDGLSYDEAYPIAADYKITAQCILHGARCAYIPRPLCVFETGGESQIHAKQGRIEQIAIRKELGLSAPLTPYRQCIGQIIKSISTPVYWMVRRSFRA